MTAFLLDVNVLVAMSWPGHRFHETALRWFAHNQRKGWATCPMVQTGFVRIVSNPAFSPRAVSPKQAIDALNISLQSRTHQFWADDISVADVQRIDRKSTRLNSSHLGISYAVFCLKKNQI